MGTNEQFRKSLIDVLVAERSNRKLSHEKIAEQAGIARQTIGKIEKGSTNPTMLTMYKITEALDMPLDEFVGKVMEKLRK